MVERKLAERNDPVPEKEKSSTWKSGVFWYSISLPFVCTANILFFFWVREDLIYQWEYDYSSDGSFTWRIPILYLSHIIPLIGILLDFALNRVVLSYKHLVVSLLFTLLYFFASFVGQLL